MDTSFVNKSARKYWAEAIGTLPPAQLWLFWLAPLVGAVIAGWAYRKIFADD